MAGKFLACLALAISLHSTAFGCKFYPLRLPVELDSYLQQYDEAKARFEAATSAEEATELKAVLERIAADVDYIAGQRHATISRLFWYTDLDQAKAAATESGKPILSLRMLGKLTDEFSCANSRFFRSTLYANKEISDFLRNNFVLHWQSVRPVPRVTIDFGDGRKLEQTITGNSAHYLLTAEGQPLDVLPGLNSPREFMAWLNRGAELAAAYKAGMVEAQKLAALKKYHESRQAAIVAAMTADLKRLAADDPRETQIGIEFFDQSPDERIWRKIAALHRDSVAIDESSVALITAENPNAFQAGAISAAKSAVENPLLAMIGRFENSIALDTVRNEYQLHRAVHGWFLAGEYPTDYDALNERVYAELFLTPLNDPWLGLVPADAYTALDNGGLVTDAH